MGVLDDLSQLIEDQPRLEFQRGCQGMRNFQQRGLLMGAGFGALVKALFQFDPLADISDNSQQAGAALISKHPAAPFGVKRRAIAANMQRPCIEQII